MSFLVTQAPARLGRTLALVLLPLWLAPLCMGKDYLVINSTPSGATVEIDGLVVGKTPYRAEIPGGYLRGARSVFGKLLRQQMHARLTLEGYLPKDADLARGPMPWVAFNGTYHGDYWLLKASTFDFSLEQAATVFTGSIQANLGSSPSTLRGPTLSSEQIVQMANASVLVLRGSEGMGSGFLVSDTGVAVTNAHVAKGQSNITAMTGNGQSFNARVEYIDPTLDLALLKLDGTGFPHLTVAELSTIGPGSTVLAIGTPSHGLPNTVTRGIVGGIGSMPSQAGTWIQTDAAINPGNSGGPLLNESGEVVGINTQKAFTSGDGRPLQGIGFALSANDLLEVLRKVYPNVSAITPAAQRDRTLGKGKITITADSGDAEVFLDGKFIGNTPSTLILTTGLHNVEVKNSSGATWKRDFEVLPDSDVSLKAVLMTRKLP
ncbi:MAG TPA: trypsin-like peptidase domain-containing protein [Terriglobales bacterium]